MREKAKEDVEESPNWIVHEVELLQREQGKGARGRQGGDYLR